MAYGASSAAEGALLSDLFLLAYPAIYQSAVIFTDGIDTT